mgnify:FL=1
MFNRIANIIVTCFILISCNQTGKYFPPDKKDSSKADSLTSLPQPVETGLPENDQV